MLIAAILIFLLSSCPGLVLVGGLTLPSANSEGKIVLVVICVAVFGLIAGFGAGFLVLRSMILKFSRAAAIVATVLASALMFLGVLNIFIGCIRAGMGGNPAPGVVQVAIGVLIALVFGRVLSYLIDVIKEF